MSEHDFAFFACLFGVGILIIMIGLFGVDLGVSGFGIGALLSLIIYLIICSIGVGMHWESMDREKDEEQNHRRRWESLAEPSYTTRCRNCRTIVHDKGYCVKCYMNLLKYMEEKKSGKKFKVLKKKEPHRVQHAIDNGYYPYSSGLDMSDPGEDFTSWRW